MTPLEKAAAAVERDGMAFLDGLKSHGASWVDVPNEVFAKAAIRAFLEAAAEDEAARIEISRAMAAVTSYGPSDLAKAAILALKETING